MTAIAEGPSRSTDQEAHAHIPRLSRVRDRVHSARSLMGDAAGRMAVVGAGLLEGPVALLRQSPSPATESVLPELNKAGFLQHLDTPASDTRTALILSGGGMAGIVTAEGLVPFLQEREDGSRLTDNVHAINGVSVGAVNGLYVMDALARSEQLDPIALYESFATPKFINRKILPGGLHLDYLRARMAHDIPNPEKFRDEVPIDFYIGLTRESDGGKELLNTRTMTGPEIYDAAAASSSASYVTDGLTVINGDKYGDGNLAGIPAAEMIDLGFNNIGVFLNYPPGSKSLTGLDRVVVNEYLARTHYPTNLRWATYYHDELSDQSLMALEDPRVHAAAIFAPEPHEQPVHILSTESSVLETAGRESRDRVVYDINTHLPHLVQSQAAA